MTTAARNPARRMLVPCFPVLWGSMSLLTERTCFLSKTRGSMAPGIPRGQPSADAGAEVAAGLALGSGGIVTTPSTAGGSQRKSLV